MATYAAVVSLMNTMDAVMNDPRISTCFDKEQIQALGLKLDVLLKFIENYNSLGRDEEVEILNRRIVSAAHATEDVIESHTADQVKAGVLKKSKSFSIDLHQIIHAIDHIKEEIVEFEEKGGSNDELQHRYYSTPTAQPLTTGKATMVGFDDYLIQLLDGLTGLESGRQVIPIVGMGGVGKTTLTRNAYENLLTVQHFDVRAWVSISQQYNVTRILTELLSSLGQLSKLEKLDEGQLAERLHKFLCGRRYLIVLDDMWSFKAWDKIKFCFPDDHNSSRIIVTTRLFEVANDFSSSRVVRMGLLDDDKSWDLFCDKAFAQEGCPSELEKIGKKIVEKCKGLPLSIVVIGALLGKSSRAKEYWENIGENISSIVNSAEDILCLSYNHLPAHLKPCFLYLGIFPKDHQILVSRLIKLWIAEGFIKPVKDQRLEEVAEGYINDLFERSLILVDSLGWNKKFESFHMHDLVRDLCLREAQREKFICVIDTDEYPPGIDTERCIVHGGGDVSQYLSLVSLVARSITTRSGQPYLLDYTLVRVLVVDNFNDNYEDPARSFRQLNMRLLAYDSYRTYCASAVQKLPRSIFRLWNLQTLMFKDIVLESQAPAEIWKLRQLRHVEFYSITLPEPIPLSNEFVLHNLQTLMRVEDFSCSEEVCKRIPNIKRLGLFYQNFSKKYHRLENVGRLNKLESLSCVFYAKPDHDHLVQSLKLPSSLKELCLMQCELQWDDGMRIIGSLPNLEVLKLLPEAFVGSEWNCREGEFLRLKYLQIECEDLEKWNVESCDHFPVLDTVVVKRLFRLNEMPWSIREIPTLRCIRVEESRQSYAAAVSAMKILEEQESGK